MNLEEKVMVTLYRVATIAYHIEHDSPCIGAYETHGPWRTEHGLCTEKKSAQVMQGKIIEQYLQKGYTLVNAQDGHLDKNYDSPTYVTVESILVEKKDLCEKDGVLYYKETKLIPCCPVRS
ncbi:hypothetical protein HY639_02315 [Candidatus Woesearchaeota archaeon]|nr:hypothetical protein [Candidatus Woesearchaeota archaeon]